MVNIKDIAKVAGVGVSTVSRVLNNQPDVKDTTKEKVLKVIKELNYIPNNSARNLKRLKTNHIGVFVVGEYNSFFSKIIEIIEKKTSQEGYSIVLHFNNNVSTLLENAVEFSLEKKLTGLICLGGKVAKKDEGYLEQIKIPVVFGSTIIDDKLDSNKFSSVNIDNKKSVNNAVEYLLELNHKEIGLISAIGDELSVAKIREKSYSQILNNHNITCNKNMITYGDYSMESGYNSMIELLEKNKYITSVFAIADLMAIGAMKAISDKGLKVPEDISVIGFDGLEIGNYMTPSLATIKQPGEEMGNAVIDTMLNQLKEDNSVSHILLETELIKNTSCKRRNK